LSTRDLARTVAKDLVRYRNGRWRFDRGEPSPADPVRAAMWRVLTLDRGKVLTADSLRQVLAGLGAKKAPLLRQQ
jgi:hypothetical protein